MSKFPDAAMNIVEHADRYDLLAALESGVQVFATVPFTPDTREARYADAELLASSFLLYWAISDLIEDAQPDGWDKSTLEGAAWAKAFIAFMAAGEHHRVTITIRPPR